MSEYSEEQKAKYFTWHEIGEKASTVLPVTTPVENIPSVLQRAKILGDSQRWTLQGAITRTFRRNVSHRPSPEKLLPSPQTVEDLITFAETLQISSRIDTPEAGLGPLLAGFLHGLVGIQGLRRDIHGSGDLE